MSSNNYNKVLSGLNTGSPKQATKKKQFSTQVRADYLEAFEKIVRLKEKEYARQLLDGSITGQTKAPTKVEIVEEMFRRFIESHEDDLKKEGLW